MITITDIIKSIIVNDEIAYEALRLKLLNCNAYARIIHKSVEDARMEYVQVDTISTILRRLQNDQEFLKAIKPKFKLNNLSIKAPLFEITYDLVNFNYHELNKIVEKINPNDDFITLSRGNKEISVICSEKVYHNIIDKIKAKPKIIIDNLGAVSTSFSEEFFHEPNLIYAILGELGIKRIDLIELISTYTEITFIVKNEDISKTLNALNKLLN